MRWISFAQSDSLTRSIVHILPTTRGGVVAQAISCTIELFGDRPETAEVAIDGMRLNQPDGIRLDEAFVRLKEGGNSLIGVAVSLEPAQAKSDLRNSTCMMELFSRERMVRFVMPICDGSSESNVGRAPIPVIADYATQTSIILVNRGQQFNEIELRLASVMSNNEHQATPLNVSIAPQSLSEYSLAPLLVQAKEPFQTSWGDVTLVSAEICSQVGADVAGFIVYREIGTQRIISVVNI